MSKWNSKKPLATLALLAWLALTAATSSLPSARANSSYPFETRFEQDLSSIALKVPHVDGIQVTRVFDFIRTVVIRIDYAGGLPDSKRITSQNRVQEELQEESYIQAVERDSISCIPEDRSCPPWPGFVIGELMVMFVDVSTDPTIHPWPDGSTLVASNVAPTSLTLTWTSTRDGANIVDYRIFGSNNLFATVSNMTHSYFVAGLMPESPYSFRVGATNVYGDYFSGATTYVVTPRPTTNVPVPGSAGAASPGHTANSDSNQPTSLFLRYWYISLLGVALVAITSAVVLVRRRNLSRG